MTSYILTPGSEEMAGFPLFRRLPREIQLHIWDMARPVIIDAEFNSDGIIDYQKHPFLVTCKDSHAAYERTEPYFKLSGITRFVYEEPNLTLCGNLRYILLAKPEPAEYSLFWGAIFDFPYLKEVRMFIVDVPINYQPSPASQFRRICPPDHCASWSTTRRSQACQACRWESRFNQKLEQWFPISSADNRFILTLDSGLPKFPSLEQVEASRNPLLRWVKDPEWTPPRPPIPGTGVVEDDDEEDEEEDYEEEEEEDEEEEVILDEICVSLH